MTKRNSMIWGVVVFFIVVAVYFVHKRTGMVNHVGLQGEGRIDSLSTEIHVSSSSQVKERNSVAVTQNATFTYPVDYKTCSVDGVPLCDSVENITAQIGRQNVVEKTEYLEAQPSVMYEVSFGTHVVSKHWNCVTFADTIFRDENGLGVGSKLSLFVAHYGPPELSDEMGEHFTFYIAGSRRPFPQIVVSIDKPFDVPDEKNVEPYLDANVTEVTMW